MEPKYYSLIFLGCLYSLTTFVDGFICCFSLSWLWMGIIIGLGIIAHGGYYAYLYFVKAQTKEEQIYDGIIALICIGGGLTAALTPIYNIKDYHFLSRFFLTILIAGSLHVMGCIYWYIPIQKWGNGTIPTLGMSDMKQTIFFFITSIADILILAIAFSINFGDMAKFWSLFLRSFISAIFAFAVGVATSFYLYTKSSGSGYETPASSEYHEQNDVKFEDPLAPELAETQ